MSDNFYHKCGLGLWAWINIFPYCKYYTTENHAVFHKWLALSSIKSCDEYYGIATTGRWYIPVLNIQEYS